MRMPPATRTTDKHMRDYSRCSRESSGQTDFALGVKLTEPDS